LPGLPTPWKAKEFAFKKKTKEAKHWVERRKRGRRGEFTSKNRIRKWARIKIKIDGLDNRNEHETKGRGQRGEGMMMMKMMMMMKKAA
jgi:hypothetical protein